jgi:hypothetical protein
MNIEIITTIGLLIVCFSIGWAAAHGFIIMFEDFIKGRD